MSYSSISFVSKIIPRAVISDPPSSVISKTILADSDVMSFTSRTMVDGSTSFPSGSGFPTGSGLHDANIIHASIINTLIFFMV